MLVYAIITITLALVFYTAGVWGEKIQGILKRPHLALFWAGFVFDTTGTTLMGRIAGDTLRANFHAITGIVAIALMLIHAVWATWVLVKKDENTAKNFHKFSIFVWILWLIPYLSGMVMGMMR